MKFENTFCKLHEAFAMIEHFCLSEDDLQIELLKLRLCVSIIVSIKMIVQCIETLEVPTEGMKHL